ncbi:hypothetical protein ACFFUE_01700 [Bergeyella porcorum]
MRGLGGLLDGKKAPPKGEYYLPKGIKRTKTAIRRAENKRWNPKSQRVGK